MSGRVVKLDPAAHKVADALLPWFVNGTLDADERALVEQHLGECPRCKDEVDWLRGLYTACAAGEGSKGASSAYRKLKGRLEASTDRPRRPPARLPAWHRVQPWTRWLIAAQLAVIVGLGAMWFQDSDHPATYRTLGARSVAAAPTGSLVVVFDPSTAEGDLRRILRDADARVIDGPTQSNAYVLDVPPDRRTHALQVLRSERSIAFVEELDPSGRR